jgi:hypothetical protein
MSDTLLNNSATIPDDIAHDFTDAPDPTHPDQLLYDFISSKDDLFHLAANNNLTLDDLIAWFNSAEVQARIRALEEMAAAQTSLRARLHSPTQIDRLAALAGSNTNPIERRRAATTILKHAPSPRPPTRQPGRCANAASADPQGTDTPCTLEVSDPRATGCGLPPPVSADDPRATSGGPPTPVSNTRKEQSEDAAPDSPLSHRSQGSHSSHKPPGSPIRNAPAAPTADTSSSLCASAPLWSTTPPASSDPSFYPTASSALARAAGSALASPAPACSPAWSESHPPPTPPPSRHPPLHSGP